MQHVLSIQSWVAYGHVGNAAAVFPLQRLGCEVWSIHTVQFSNHTGYGQWKGRVLDAAFVQEVFEGIRDRGVLPQCDAVLSGYLGDASTGEAVLSAVRAVKQANPAALYCCDPVMGDAGRGFFVRDGIPAFFRDQVVPHADILTPNHFELEYLAGKPVTHLADGIAAARSLVTRGPRWVLVTSFRREGADPHAIEMLLVSATEAWLVATPKLALQVNGTGDLMAALFLGHFLQERDVEKALARATSGIFGVLSHTAHTGAREMQLIAAQQELTTPSISFVPVSVA